MTEPFPLRILGGNKIRMLRERKGWSQETLAEKAYTTRNWISHIELGYRKVRGKKIAVIPDPKTIHSIVYALQPTFGERRSILESYGLDCPIDLPTDEEIVWACYVFHHELAGLNIPAYLLDCGLRLHDWNAYVPKVLGIEPSVLETFRGHYLIELYFDRQVQLIGKMANRDQFLAMNLRVTQHLLWPYQKENWAHDVMQMYDPSSLVILSELGPVADIPARPLVEIQFQPTETLALRFRIMQEPYTRDDRFRVIYVLPSDEVTQIQFDHWGST